jgi:citrate lyase subunit beta/citryl-CoA lyase
MENEFLHVLSVTDGETTNTAVKTRYIHSINMDGVIVQDNDGKESLWLRQQVVNAARAAGVQPIDTVFSDVADSEGLRQSVLEAKSLGFDGKGCIHPRQIPVIHDAFAPSDKEVERAKRIVLAFEQAQSQGLAAVSLGSKMIDPPVVKRALHTVDLAVACGILAPNWKEQREVQS